jgi:ferrochelatase
LETGLIGMAGGRRIAVVLLNLGGPDSLAAVAPFLRNLFNDPAIIDLPRLLRRFVAMMIVRRRAPTARAIYDKIGGRSPLLPNTEAQAAALSQELREFGEIRVFCCMRYWHPMSESAAAAVHAFGPDEIVLLPLYPQFSSTTTASSYDAWLKAAAAAGLQAPTKLICCYPTASGFVTAAAELVSAGIAEAAARVPQRARILFSAHGLPEKVIRRGDPYPRQVEQTAHAIAARLGATEADWVVCYQSRVGPLRWIGPQTDDEIRRAGADRVPVVLFPVAFVSEHSETLVELDIDYRHLAELSQVPCYVRVPTVGTSPAFIAGLAELVRAAVASPRPVCSESGRRICKAAEACCLNGAV